MIFVSVFIKLTMECLATVTLIMRVIEWCVMYMIEKESQTPSISNDDRFQEIIYMLSERSDSDNDFGFGLVPTIGVVIKIHVNNNVTETVSVISQHFYAAAFCK
eukprot:215637_1